jgi:hypothetical protein
MYGINAAQRPGLYSMAFARSDVWPKANPEEGFTPGLIRKLAGG